MGLALKWTDYIFAILFVGLLFRYAKEASFFVSTTGHTASDLLSVVSLQSPNTAASRGTAVS